MFYYKNLDKLVLKKKIDYNGTTIEADEIIIVSGYVSAYPISELIKLRFDKINIIGGMYNRGISKKEYDDLVRENDNNSNLNIYFTKKQIHSKLYVWKKNEEIVFGLIGSANLTKSGLNTNKRECLSEISTNDYHKLDDYLNYVNEIKIKITDFDENLLVENIDSTENTEEIFIDSTRSPNSYNSTSRSVILPLHTKKKVIEEKSGLNWGLAKAKNKIDDAYIAVSAEKVRENMAFFQPFIVDSKKDDKSIDVIWDDGVKMRLTFEGTQTIGDFVYPKQVSSFLAKGSQLNSEGDKIQIKSILGRYLRKRINIESGKLVTYAMLESYGRTSIELFHIKGDLYFADFSVQEEGEG